MMQKNVKIIETLAHGYSSESTRRELFNEYQHDRVYKKLKKTLHPCALDESSLSIGRVKTDYLCSMMFINGHPFKLSLWKQSFIDCIFMIG